MAPDPIQRWPVVRQGDTAHPGLFGPQTEGGVRGVRQAPKIAADGTAGPVTWRAVVSGMPSG